MLKKVKIVQKRDFFELSSEMVHIRDIMDEVLNVVAENSTGKSASARGPSAMSLACVKGRETAVPCGILPPSFMRAKRGRDPHEQERGQG